MHRAGVNWPTLIAAACLLACGHVGAQQPAYRCGTHAHPTYSDVPCPGAHPVGPGRSQTTNKWSPPPQDRAVIAKRARLSADERQQCSALDTQLADEKAMLKTKGDSVNIEDEMPLVRMQKRFRELKC